ncbi:MULTISPECIES: copper uptake system-associated protein [Pseudomonas]|uniref:Copper uptake system-associated protein n=2 Tax=Pseudomonas TaxID=286 RepID=A0A3Q8U2Y4_9PSED|nr:MULTISPECIES: copper uptake system-associated protein [Pseudomonas]AZL69365.1 copper uptake system-associated protein [Pseudomonas oryziphila]MDE4536298.1 copper uptake system-associated protein [Pseudomonas sp. ITEM 17296]
MARWRTRYRLCSDTLEGDHAVAGWLQDQRGGRALLRKGHGWGVVLCAGDSLLDPASLRSAGLREQGAERLSQAVREAERSQPTERIRQFALFHGVVKDAAHGNH